MTSSYRTAFAGFSGFTVATHASSEPEAVVTKASVSQLPTRKSAAKRVARDPSVTETRRAAAA